MPRNNQILQSLLVLMVVATLALPALAQSSTAQSPLSAGTHRPTFADESPRANLVGIGFNVSSTYDDNAEGFQKKSNVLSEFTTTFRLNMVRPRWNLVTEYLPGYSYNSEISGYNALSQASNFSLQYRFSPHFTMSLRNHFSKVSNPFRDLELSNSGSPFGVVDTPNPTGLGENLERTTEQAGADVTYQIDARTAFGLGAGYSLLQSKAPNTSVLIQDSISPSANAFFSRRLTPTQTAGFQYRWQRIDANGGLARTDTHSIFYFHSFNITRHVKLTAFGGPEGTESRLNALGTVQSHPVEWSWSAGGTFDWQGVHNAANASVVRQVGDAGTLGGVVRVTNLAGGFNHRLSASSTVGLNANYTRNRSFDALVSPTTTGDYVSAGVDYHRVIFSHVGMTLAYWHVEATNVSTLLPPNLQSNHNRVSISLSYEFERPIGR